MSKYCLAFAAVLFCISRAGLAGSITTAPIVTPETQGLWIFEEQPAGASTTSTGTSLVDSSGNGHDIVKTNAFGVLRWSDDVPAIQPDGSTSQHVTSATGIGTAATDAFSIANTGALTIEFWFKPTVSSTLHGILDYGTAANAWGILQEVPSGGSFNIEFGYTDDNNTFRAINTSTTWTASADWFHYAIVIDTVAVDIAVYIDGVEDAATAGVDENIDSFTFDTTAYELQLGSLTTGFGNTMYIDDLRISNAALVPGSGSGENGELAYNVTLVPEPGSLGGLAAIGAMMIARRRTRHTTPG